MVTDRIGQQLGNYHLIRLIGQGGFGEVYLGEHIYLKTQAAIKVLQVRLANEDIEAFLNEARTIANLKHPHIVRVLDFGIDGGTPFLVMDYAPYGTLRQRYPKGTRPPFADVISIVKQVSAALQYAHDKKLIHRDVKPENMLIGENNEVLLSDFGIALVAQSSRYQSTQEVVGTVAYMAPEQLQGKPRPASDQYALGIVVYEWLCGERPFHGTFTELFSQHVFVPPPPLHNKLPEISTDLESVVLTALAKEPERRYASVSAFSRALEQASEPDQLVPFVPRNEAIVPTSASVPHTQHVWPEVNASSPSRPMQPGSMRTPSGGDKLVKQGISRRAMVTGLAGLATIGIVGSITWLTLSHHSSGPIATPTPRPTSTPSHSPIPAQGTTLYTFTGHEGGIRVLQWSPRSNRIATGSNDHTAKVWGAIDGSNVVTYTGHSSYVEGVAWSPDGSRIASGSADTTVQIWDSNTAVHYYTYTDHKLWVNRVSWSPNGQYIVSGEQSSRGGYVVQARVWEAATGNTLVVYTGHTYGIFSVAWSPDGTRIASIGYDGTLQIWNALTGKPVATFNARVFLWGLSWSPDSTHVVVGGYSTNFWVIDATTGNVSSTYNVVNTDAVVDLGWSPDGTRIVAGTGNSVGGGGAQIFDYATGARTYTYTQPGNLDGIGWSNNSQMVASADGNTGVVKVWEA